MELQFVKQGGEWVAEFEATSDFNINLDRTDKGYLLIYQKGSADGTWATYPSYKNYKEAANIDVDVTALIYPKYIKVVSQSEVEKAIVTMEGESGGSGAGGGLRPITADDVLLMFGGEGPNGDVVEFSNTISTPSFKALYVMSNKPLYAGGNMNYALKTNSYFSPHPDYTYTYQLGEYSNSYNSPITLDLYIQD